MSDPFDYVRYAVVSDRGLVRETNEDAFVALSTEGVFAVADGMGGGSKGELASQWVAEEITRALVGSQRELPGVRMSALEEAVGRANRHIAEEKRLHGYEQMGSTVAVLLLNPWHPRMPLVAHVGDSRVYRWRPDGFTRLTADHTVGDELARQTGDFALADARTSRLSHVLTRAVGMSERVAMEWTRDELADGDRYLLCTDGFSTLLDDACLSELLAAAHSPESACAMLSEAVREAGAVDNFTAIVLFVTGRLPVPRSPEGTDEAENEYLMKRFGL